MKKRVKQLLSLGLLCMISTCPSWGQDSARVTDLVSISLHGATPSRLSVLLPFPQSNQYQQVGNVDKGEGQVYNVENSTNKYLRYQFQRPSGEEITAAVSFDHQPIHFASHLPDSGIVLQYDTEEPEYLRFTASSGAYAVPDNPIIDSIAGMLWQQSGGTINFVRRCYDYVAFHYGYMNPNTGLHPLEQILEDGGGDCGNLSSIFISLLRNRGIPARHVVAYFVGEECHVWAEFMTPDGDWIPVDVTYHQSDPYNDYFGVYQQDAIIAGYDVYLRYERWNQSGMEYMSDLLQNFHWWYWGGNDAITTSWRVTSEPITHPEAIESAASTDALPTVTTCKGGIWVKGAANQRVRLYDISGHLLMQVTAEQESIRMMVPHSGVYLVQADNLPAQKIVIVR